MVCDAMHCKSHRTPSSHPSRNRDACVCGHEFRDIYLLVEEASQCQSACSSIQKIRVKGDAATSQRTDPRDTVHTDIDLETISTLIVGGQIDEDIDLRHEDRVPRFWSDTTDEDVIIAHLIMLGVGVCFGAIHCIAWHFSFPTHTELLIWRISSVAITALPLYIPLMIGFGMLLGVSIDTENLYATVVYLSAGLLYILARAVTLILAFTSLRDLPPGAYESVHWTTFIPHV